MITRGRQLLTSYVLNRTRRWYNQLLSEFGCPLLCFREI